MGTNNAIEYLQRYQILIFIYYKFYFIIFIIIQFTVYVKNTVLKWRGRVRARKHFKLRLCVRLLRVQIFVDIFQQSFGQFPAVMPLF